MLLSIAVVTGVAECVVAELEDTLGGVPNRVCPVVPGSIAWDDCQCGQLAQTITSVAPTATFPQPATDQALVTCAAPMVVVSVTLSLTRCVPGIDDRGNAPSCDQMLHAAMILEDDRSAVRRAVNCCLRDKLNINQIFNYSIGAANTVGPEGGCAGIDLTYQFALANDCCG